DETKKRRTFCPVRRTLTLRKAAGLAVVGIFGLAALGHVTSGKETLFSQAEKATVKQEQEILEFFPDELFCETGKEKAIAEKMKKIGGGQGGP
ncbi:unnamed protein product, partial [Polarella glacialis]